MTNHKNTFAIAFHFKDDHKDEDMFNHFLLTRDIWLVNHLSMNRSMKTRIRKTRLN